MPDEYWSLTPLEFFWLIWNHIEERRKTDYSIAWHALRTGQHPKGTTDKSLYSEMHPDDSKRLGDGILTSDTIAEGKEFLREIIEEDSTQQTIDRFFPGSTILKPKGLY